MKVYFANDLFSTGAQMYNAWVVKQIRERVEGVEVFLPQEAPINDKSKLNTSRDIFNLDTEELLSSDVLVAVLDGLAIDPGVASELGIFYSTGKPIIGIYTDPRSVSGGSQDIKNATEVIGENPVSYVNMYVTGLIKERGELVDSHEEAIRLLKNIKHKEGK